MPRIDAEVISFVGQAWAILASSQLRYWSRAAETWGRLAPEMLQNATSGPDGSRPAAMRAAVIDTLRTGLGEMVELQVAEARRIESELVDLAARVWPSSAPTEGGDGFRRRWTVKE